MGAATVAAAAVASATDLVAALCCRDGGSGVALLLAVGFVPRRLRLMKGNDGFRRTRHLEIFRGCDLGRCSHTMARQARSLLRRNSGWRGAGVLC